MNTLQRMTMGGLTAILALLLLHTASQACTSIGLMAEDGALVYGRTMEWGTFDLKSRLVVVPRGHVFQSETPDGKPGVRWEAKYGVAAFDALEKDLLSDGMNEKGLVVGMLYHPGFAQYQSYDPARASSTLSSSMFPNYVLTQFATVDEVRAGLEKIRVCAVTEPALGKPAPLHLTVMDPSGKAIVVEYLEGKLRVFDNPLRVLTNSPSFDWHMTNLRNYVNLSAVAWPAKKLDDLTLAPIGGGSGFLGLPGDFTPPSRFIRAVAYSQTARKTPDGDETVYEVFRILDNFTLPAGSAEGPGADPAKLAGMRSSTLWTCAADTRNLKLYYHTQHNRRVRVIDLKRVDFSSGKQIRRFPLDRKKRQDMEDVTP